MNSITLCGNLSKDPEVSTTSGGKTLCKFSIAVNRDFEEGCDFFDCTAWGKTGENIGKYFSKGKKILLQGRVKISDFTNNEGNKRRQWQIVVNNFEFVSSRSETESSPRVEYQKENRATGSVGSYDTEAREPIDDDDDLPF